MTNIRVRDATRADIERIAEFQQAMAIETEGRALDPSTIRQGITAVFDDPQKGFYIVAVASADDDDAPQKIVGSLLMTYEWSDWSNATHWWIQSVYVDAAWRRRGVYRAMYDHILGMTKAAATSAAFASTSSAPTPSPSRPTRASACAIRTTTSTR